MVKKEVKCEAKRDRERVREESEIVLLLDGGCKCKVWWLFFGIKSYVVMYIVVVVFVVVVCGVGVVFYSSVVSSRTMEIRGGAGMFMMVDFMF